MLPDIEAVTAILEETAAEEILPRFRSLKDHEIRDKGRGDLVTVADVAAEKRITERLLDLLPDATVVGEEAVDAEPELLEDVALEDLVWVIDPIDGTGNFARGKPVFAVMVALIQSGRTVAGWIHDPIAPRTATAEQGSGAWLGDERLRVAAGGAPSDMRGTLHAGAFAPPDMARQVQARRDRVGAIKSLRCAGHEYLRLASGEMHFSLFTRLMPWDHAPGGLIHGEAGGVGRTLDAAPYGARSYRGSGLLLAPDETSWRALHVALFGGNRRAH